MRPSAKSNQIRKINTSASENWCGYYAIANCLKYKDKNQRNLAYAMIGLDHDDILNSYFLELKQVFKSCKEISEEDYEKLKAQKLQEMLTFNDAIGEEKTTKNNKQRHIIQSKIQKILNDEAETKEEIKMEYYDKITKPKTGFGYQELKELYEHSQSGNRFCFSWLDTSGYINAKDEEIDVGEIKENVTCLEPNLYQKLMGFVLFKKWNTDWKHDFISEQAGVLDEELEAEMGSDSFISAEVVRIIASNLGFEYVQGVKKINERILSKKFSEDDEKNLMYIRNPQGVHFTAFVTESQIANLVKEAMIRHEQGHNAVAKGGDVRIDSQSPKAQEDDKVKEEIRTNLQVLNDLGDKHFQFSKRYNIDNSEDRIVFYKNASNQKILVIKLLDKNSLIEGQAPYEFQFNLDDNSIKKFNLDLEGSKQPIGDEIKITRVEDLKNASDVLKKKKEKIKDQIDILNSENSTQPNPQITGPEAQGGARAGGGRQV